MRREIAIPLQGPLRPQPGTQGLEKIKFAREAAAQTEASQQISTRNGNRTGGPEQNTHTHTHTHTHARTHTHTGALLERSARSDNAACPRRDKEWYTPRLTAHMVASQRGGFLTGAPSSSPNGVINMSQLNSARSVPLRAGESKQSERRVVSLLRCIHLGCTHRNTACNRGLKKKYNDQPAHTSYQPISNIQHFLYSFCLKKQISVAHIRKCHPCVVLDK